MKEDEYLRDGITGRHHYRAFKDQKLEDVFTRYGVGLSR